MIYAFQVNNHVEIPSHMWIGAWMRPKLHLSLPSVPLNRQTLEVCLQLYVQHGPLFYSTTFVLFDYFSDTILSQIIMESQENGGNHYILVTPSCMHKKDIFFLFVCQTKTRKKVFFSLDTDLQKRNVDPHPLSSFYVLLSRKQKMTETR